ncbi:MAG: sensor domain-containing phosphodiesterase, partial [Pseudomonadota bacterium]
MKEMGPEDLLVAQQHVHGQIADGQPLESIVTSVCALGEQALPGAVVSVMLHDPGSATLRLVQTGRFSSEYWQAAQDLPVGPDSATCGVAAHYGEMVVTPDIRLAPEWAPYREFSDREGFRSCWSTPVFGRGDGLLGTFGVYYREPRKPTAHEQKLLQGLSRLLAVAIQHHQDQKALQLGRERFRSLFARHPDAVLEFDAEGHFLAGNRSFQHIAGPGDQRWIGIHFGEFLRGTGRKAANAGFQRAIRGKASNSGVATFAVNDQCYSMEITWLPVELEEQVVGVYLIGRDVTERRRIEEELRLLRRGVEASPDGMLLVDVCREDMPTVYVNRGFEKLTGYHRDEVLGRNYCFLQGPDTSPEALDELGRALRERAETQQLLWSYRRDGSGFWNELSIGPVLDDEGKCTHYFGIIQDVSRQIESERQLLHDSTHDRLTGLPNRSGFESRLPGVCQSAAQSGRSVGLVYLDVDGFSPVNDALGRQVGDLLLSEVAKRLSRVLPAGGLLARFEADEFVLAFPDCAYEQRVDEHAKRVLSAMTEQFEVVGHHLHVSASLGVTLCHGVRDADASAIQRANLAMRRAKESGRNNWQWYGEGMQGSREYIELRRDIQHAMDTDAFRVYYQPLVGARSGEIRSVEALIRWPDSESGMISPGRFIPVAESTGQIIAIGRWVLFRACQEIARFNAREQQSLAVAVNISPMQFRREGFIDDVVQALADSGLEPRLLELEVTEGVLMRSTEEVMRTLRRIRDLDVRVVIDDFGTGFSSL